MLSLIYKRAPPFTRAMFYVVVLEVNIILGIFILFDS